MRFNGALAALLLLALTTTGCNSRSTFSGITVDLRDRNAVGTCTIEFERNRIDNNAWPPEADQRSLTTFYDVNGMKLGSCSRFFSRGLPDENSATLCDNDIPHADINCVSYCANNRARVYFYKCVSQLREDTQQFEDFNLGPV